MSRLQTFRDTISCFYSIKLHEQSNFFFPGQKQVFDGKDAVVFAYRLNSSEQAKTGDGMVCKLKFKALASGHIRFAFGNSQVRDASLSLVDSDFQEYLFESISIEATNVHYFEIEIV